MLTFSTPAKALETPPFTENHTKTIPILIEESIVPLLISRRKCAFFKHCERSRFSTSAMACTNCLQAFTLHEMFQHPIPSMRQGCTVTRSRRNHVIVCLKHNTTLIQYNHITIRLNYTRQYHNAYSGQTNQC